MITEQELTKAMYRTGEAAKYLGVSRQTVQRWIHIGKLSAHRIRNEYRDTVQVPREELIRMLQERHMLAPAPMRRSVYYARVSSYGQKEKGDLDRQILLITELASGCGAFDPLIIKDTGSGLNPKRKGLLRMMDMARKGEIAAIYVANRDRLTRFGFEYLKAYFDLCGVEIVVLAEETEKTPQLELVDDLMSLLASFSGKLYGMRSRDRKRLRNRFEDTVGQNE